MALVTPAPEIRVAESSRDLVDGRSADFSWTTVGHPVTKTFTISNQGSVSLTALSLGKTGANPGDYTLGSLTSTSLVPGASISFSVTFSPTAIGASLAMLNIISNDPDENPYHIALVGRTPMAVTGWGWGASGQTDQPPGLGDVVALATGYNHSLALRSNGTVVAWGENGNGQTDVPAGLTGVKAIAAGWYHSLALRTDGTVALWGSNSNGKSTVPPGLGSIGGFAAGGNHMLALVAPMPDIAVSHGLNRTSDGGTVGFGISGTTGCAERTFTILNHGTQTLSGLALSKSGADAADFSIGTLGATALVPGATTTFTATFQTTLAGSKSAVIHIASNDPDESPYDLTLTGATGMLPIEVWRQFWFGVTYNGDNAWDEADPDLDGLPNFVEFAFGTDPTRPHRASLIYTGPPGGGTLTATGQPIILHQNIGGTPVVRGLFVRREDAAAAGLTYTPQLSADLATWTTPAPAPALFAADGPYELAAVTFPALLNGRPPRLFRVVVSITP